MEGRLRRAEEFGKSRLEFDGAPISPLKPFVLLPQRSFDDRLPRDGPATSGQNCKTWNGCVGPIQPPFAKSGSRPNNMALKGPPGAEPKMRMLPHFG